jgi:hypothetical protein
MSASEAYKRAVHCGVGGHDCHSSGGHDDIGDQVWEDRCALAVDWARYRKALNAIAAIEDKPNGGDWDEIEQAREIAREALETI